MICVVYEVNSYEEPQDKVNTSLEGINKCMTTNLLTINIQKSNYMIIDFSGRNRNEIQLKIGNNLLSKVKEIKVLGVTIDDGFRFKSHIDNVCSSISSKIGVISRLKKFVPKYVLNSIFKAIIQPKIDYGITVYSHTFGSHTKKIDRLMNRASLVISSSNQDYSTIYQELNWKQLSCRKKYFSNIFYQSKVMSILFR